MNFSDCVEGHLTGISVDEESKGVDFSIRLQAGRSVVLSARGVTQLAVSEFREKNIIDRVNAWGHESKVSDFQHLLVELLTGQTDLAVDGAFSSLIERQLKAINAGETVLIEIEPVYGARVLMLAKSIALQ